MNREVSRCAVLVMVLIASCTKHEGVPVLARLQEQSQVVQDKLKVSACQIDGVDLDETSPLRANRNETLELTGVLGSMEWNVGGITCDWKDEKGGSAPRSLMRNVPAVDLALYVHGHDTTRNFGILEGVPLEARPLASTPAAYEFRVTFNAPSRPGKYVVDLQAGNMTIIPGETLTKPPGVPIWRKEIWVQ